MAFDRGIVFSCFDLLHAGHTLMLEEASSRCRHLTVGLHVDPSIERGSKNKPVQSLFERYTQLKGCKYVSEIIPYTHEADIIDILQSYNFDVRFLGEEYENTDFTGKEYCETNDVRIRYLERRHSFSSTELRERIARNTAVKRDPLKPIDTKPISEETKRRVITSTDQIMRNGK